MLTLMLTTSMVLSLVVESDDGKASFGTHSERFTVSMVCPSNVGGSEQIGGGRVTLDAISIFR